MTGKPAAVQCNLTAGTLCHKIVLGMIVFLIITGAEPCWVDLIPGLRTKQPQQFSVER